MKKLFLALLLTVIYSVGVSAQDSFYEACRADSNLETVYIGKAMLQMVHRGPGLKVENLDVNVLIGAIESIEIITANNKKGIQKLTEMSSSFNKSNGFEIMLETKEENEKVTMYSKKWKKGLNVYAIITTEPKEMTVIMITGSLTPEDLARAKR